MSNTYTWTITGLTGLDPDADTDVETVKSASWNLTGTDGTNSITINGVTPLNLLMTDGTDPEALFHDLTEASVIASVQSALGTNQVNSYYNSIDNNLAARLVAQPITPPLPWVV